MMTIHTPSTGVAGHQVDQYDTKSVPAVHPADGVINEFAR
jgi:hypothetical protein